jgi:hypothetical protein
MPTAQPAYLPALQQLLLLVLLLWVLWRWHLLGQLQ